MLFSLLAGEKHEWDSPLPARHCEAWERWLKQLPDLEKFTVPRCLKTGIPLRIQLHLYADASSSVYAAAAYLRCQYSQGEVSVRLICAKAHVVPVGKTSVPRLELMAAELAVRLRHQVLCAIKVPVDTVWHWTDSTSVLYWLNNDQKRLQMFVYNRVDKIRRGSDLSEWKWVPTAENPADLPTRGISVEQLRREPRWLKGPTFLTKGEEAWPQPPVLIPTSDTLREMKKGEQIMATYVGADMEVLFTWENYSSWQKLIRVVHRILCWRDRTRQRLGLAPRGDSWRRAELALVRQVQIPLRPEGRVSPKQHWERLGLARMLPFQDPMGVWRGGGRLRGNLALPPDAREPLLLPREHPAARLLLRDLHERVLKHSGGVSYLLSRLQARFWLPHARATAYRLLQLCVPCRRRQARPVRPPEGRLPPFRLPPLRGVPVAFAVTAMDCAGPFRVKRGRSYESYYLLLFTCCQVRAVRLEYLSDLSLDAFLLAFTRAHSHGVNPHTVLSDNGGNFEGANRLLRALWAALPQEELEQRRPEIKWRFNPPYASHYGGVFERLIRAAKESLYHVLPAHLSLSLEELVTAFAVVEGILNARPLGYVSSDGADAAPLTPGHFLYGASTAPLLLPETSSPLAKKWHSLQRMTEKYLLRFHREVRPHLQLAHSLRGGGRDLQVGDLVTFLLPSSGRMWPLARVTEVFPGANGRVRTLEVRTGGPGARVYRRDVGDVALLLAAAEEMPAGSN